MMIKYLKKEEKVKSKSSFYIRLLMKLKKVNICLTDKVYLESLSLSKKSSLHSESLENLDILPTEINNSIYKYLK